MTGIAQPLSAQAAALLDVVRCLDAAGPVAGWPLREIARAAGMSRQRCAYHMAALRRYGLVSQIGFAAQSTWLLRTGAGLAPRAVKDGKPPGPAGAEKMRACLKCRETFLSGWAGERLCRGCKAANRLLAEDGIRGTGGRVAARCWGA